MSAKTPRQEHISRVPGMAMGQITMSETESISRWVGSQRTDYPGLWQQCTKFPFSYPGKGKPLENFEWGWRCHTLINFLTSFWPLCGELIMETNE